MDRDDKWVRTWYEKSDFELVDSYLHVYLEGNEELTGHIKSEYPNLLPIHTFAHYLGKNKEEIKQKFNRVNECVCYERSLA